MTPREKMAALAAEMKSLSAKAEQENRGFTAEETTRLGEIRTEADGLKARLESAKAATALLDELSEPGSPDVDDVDDPLASWKAGRTPGAGTKSVTHPLGKAFADRAMKTVDAYGAKALLPTGEETLPISLPMIGMRRPQDSLTALMTTRELTGPTFTWLEQTTRAATAAAFVTRGALKPVSTKPDVVRREGKVSTVAHLFEGIDREYLSDVPSLQQFIEQEMVYGLGRAVDANVLNGNGAGPNLKGILQTTGVLDQPFVTDKITTARYAKSKLEVIDETPTAWAMHPNDWLDIELTRDADERFLMPGVSPQSTSRRQLWDLPVVLCRDLTPGQAILANWAQAVLFIREGIQIAWSEQVGENFRRNQLSFRCEARVGFALLKPDAFVTVDLTAGA